MVKFPLFVNLNNPYTKGRSNASIIHSMTCDAVLIYNYSTKCAGASVHGKD